MPRPEARFRMGYVPLPEGEARRIRQHLIYPTSGCSALDPCAGEGKALAIITGDAQGQRYGIELDAYRAEEAKGRLDQVIYGDCFDVDCHVESSSLVLLNPPYDVAVHEDRPSERFEALFLQHTYRWLKPGGVLILVIPAAQLAVCGNILSRQFKDTEVYRLTDPASVQYKQIVVFAVRRSRRERERLQDREINALRLDCGRKARSFDALPALSDHVQPFYAVPEAEPIELVHRGLPLDEIEDSLAQSPAYRQAQRMLFAPESRERGRPLTPLHMGHVSLLACASALDGMFGENELRHASRWQAVKTSYQTEEEDEKGVVTIRQREQFSHCLNLLYADGETAVLTADAPSPSEDPKTDSGAPANARVPVESPEGRGRKFRIEEAIGEERA
jgi:SAM-dependent methyltransferase